MIPLSAPGTRPRVVSLLASATELVCAVGGAGELVGISHECDFPEAIRDRPVLTQSRVSSELSSAAIDRAVRGAVSEALSIYRVDAEALSRLSPDLILTQDLCEVCAVSIDDVRSAVARIAKRDHLRVLSLRPTRLMEVFDDVERVAEALGRAEGGTRVRRELEGRVRRIHERALGASARPRVVSIEWIEPLMLGGFWMPDLIESVAGVAAGAELGAPAPTLGAGELRALEPDVIVVKPCGFTLERTRRERALIDASVLAQVPKARVYLSDGNAYFNRSGPRLVESLEILAACVHPELFGDFAEKHRDVTERLR